MDDVMFARNGQEKTTQNGVYTQNDSAAPHMSIETDSPAAFVKTCATTQKNVKRRVLGL